MWIGKHRALDVVPHSCKVSGRDRNREERKPLDLTDSDIWRDVTAEEQAQSDAKCNRKLKDYEDCKVKLVLHEEVEPDGETVVTKLVRALASNRTVESLYIGTQTCRHLTQASSPSCSGHMLTCSTQWERPWTWPCTRSLDLLKES